jgi:protein-S-isoprenylcysteine O-methyltransferase Ste14
MYRHMTAGAPAGAVVPPPVLFLGGWVSAAMLERMAPLPVVRSKGMPLRILGAAAAGAGLFLSSAVVHHFRKAGTPVSPLQPTRRLVTGGPYRHSRNPDYVGQILMYSGSALIANRLWPLVLLPALIGLLAGGVVAREDAYLNALFGEEYAAYAARVPRWL